MLSTIKDIQNELENLSVEELEKAVEELKSCTSKDVLENECYKNFMSKLDMEIEKSLPSVSRRASLVRKRSKSRSSAVDRFVTLSFEQKCLILQTQYEELKNHVERLKADFDGKLDTHKALSEELKSRHKEIRKNHSFFGKLISKEFVSGGARVISSERYVRISDEYCKSMDTLCDKLRLKNSSLKTTLKKTKEQLRQKETGEVLSAIDFEQMKIDNTKCLAEIDEKNRIIQKMKIVAARTLQILNGHRKKLNEALHEQKYLMEEQNQRQEMQRRIETENILAKQELIKERNLNEKYEDHISSYRVPSVIDFVKLVSEERDLTSKQNIYNRRLKIAEMALHCHKKLWSQIQHSSLDGRV